MTATETEIQRTLKPQWCNDCTLLTLTDKTPTVADDIELGGRMKLPQKPKLLRDSSSHPTATAACDNNNA